MESFRLSVEAVQNPLPPDVDRTFFWPSKLRTHYFSSNVGPSLGDFGKVDDRNVDFVRIASGVLAADRSMPRIGRLAAWNDRAISLTVDLIDPSAWEPVRVRLTDLLNFLTGDTWELHLVAGRGADEQLGMRALGADRVVLLSGGADSAAGALLSAFELPQGSKQALLSHWSAPALSPLQRRLAQQIGKVVPQVTVDHIQVHHSRGRRAPSGQSYRNENSTRSRSILFIALGLALASVNKVPLLMPENGYASINPPLAPNRRGSLSTKTTHPAFLGELQAILKVVGAHADLENPFASMTKGEMFAQVKEKLGDSKASELLSATVSCSHTGARSFHIGPMVQCGVCFGCVLRRASFVASGIGDQTTYLMGTSDPRVQQWLERKSVVQAMHDFLASPFGVDDLVSLRIPGNLALEEVADLCNRARQELRGLAL